MISLFGASGISSLLVVFVASMFYSLFFDYPYIISVKLSVHFGVPLLILS